MLKMAPIVALNEAKLAKSRGRTEYEPQIRNQRIELYYKFTFLEIEKISDICECHFKLAPIFDH